MDAAVLIMAAPGTPLARFLKGNSRQEPEFQSEIGTETGLTIGSYDSFSAAIYQFNSGI